MSVTSALQPRHAGGPITRPAASHVADVTLVPPTRIGGLVAWLVAVIVALVAGVGYWAGTAPIESAVIAPGEVEVDGRLRVVQHLEGGIVSEIHVREGDRVTAGEVLLRLDETRATAQLGILRSQFAETLARDARLAAEYEGSDRVVPSDELRALIDQSPDLAGVLAAQEELLQSNRGSDGGEAAILTERVRQLSRQREEILAERATLVEQLAIVSEDLVGLKRLYDDGLLQRQRYVDRLQNETSLRGEIARVDSREQQVLQEIAGTEQRILQVERERRLAIAAEQQEVRAGLLDLRQRLMAMEDISRRLEIRAPESGRVIGLSLNTVGAVVLGGDELMRIVPDGADYVVVAQVSPDDIDQVAVGGPARVRLSAYSMRSTVPVEGEVRRVSPDSLVDDASGATYYEVEIALSEESLAEVGEIELQPGMAAQVMVRTGAETVLTFILDPLLRGMETAMTETD